MIEQTRVSSGTPPKPVRLGVTLEGGVVVIVVTATARVVAHNAVECIVVE